MRSFFTLAILAVALISSHIATSWALPQKLFGLQLDPLPVLVMVTALRCPISTIGILAIFGSLIQNALSSNPIGTSILPLYSLGLIVHMNSKHLLFNRVGTRFMLGAAAGAFVQVLSLGILLITSHQPLVGWFSFWQLIVGAGFSGILALAFFPLTEWLDKSVEEQPLAAPYDTSTRIIRGPHIHG